MEFTAILPRAALIPIFVCLGMMFATEATMAQCPNSGTVVVDSVSNTQGKPYEAKEVQTVVTYESDGTKRVVVTKSNLFRDSRARIRQERFYDGTDDPSENVPTDIWIDDNCGTSVSLVPTRLDAPFASGVSGRRKLRGACLSSPADMVWAQGYKSPPTPLLRASPGAVGTDTSSQPPQTIRNCEAGLFFDVTPDLDEIERSLGARTKRTLI